MNGEKSRENSSENADAAKPRSAAKVEADAAAEAFFRAGRVPDITIELAPESVESLRREPRTYARCTVREGTEVVSAVAGVKLKGAAGSFREFDDRPAFTVHLDKFAGDDAPQKPRLHGLEKFHLNNSVQDPSLLSEWTAAAILRAAGQPATRVAHARVRVNERDLGVYVLKESFDDLFLQRNFKNPDGNLYDGGFCQDLDGELDRDEGPGAKDGSGDRADLARIVEACRDPDMTERWRRLEELVDIPLFVRFMALEAMLAHWDGYSFNTNNYRVYFEPGRKARFLLHGMDQCFGDPGMSVLDHPRAMLAASVMRNPEWRKLYRRELERQLDEFDGRRLSRRIAPLVERLQKALESFGFPGEAKREHAEHARGFVERVAARGQNLKAQSKEPEPKPLQFRAGAAVAISAWRPMSESEDARVEFADRDGVAVLRMGVGESGDCVAGFRRGVLLSKGRYRLDGLAMLEGVRPRREPEPGALADDPATGVGVRISGVRLVEPVLGDGERLLSHEFEVIEELADVELVVELRAGHGTVDFRADSLRLTRLRSRTGP